MPAPIAYPTLPSAAAAAGVRACLRQGDLEGAFGLLRAIRLTARSSEPFDAAIKAATAVGDRHVAMRAVRQALLSMRSPGPGAARHLLRLLAAPHPQCSAELVKREALRWVRPTSRGGVVTLLALRDAGAAPSDLAFALDNVVAGASPAVAGQTTPTAAPSGMRRVLRAAALSYATLAPLPAEERLRLAEMVASQATAMGATDERCAAASLEAVGAVRHICAGWVGRLLRASLGQHIAAGCGVRTGGATHAALLRMVSRAQVQAGRALANSSGSALRDKLGLDLPSIVKAAGSDEEASQLLCEVIISEFITDFPPDRTSLADAISQLRDVAVGFGDQLQHNAAISDHHRARSGSV